MGHPITGAAHCWSLAVEEQFYLIWPWLLRPLARRGRATMAVALAAICLSVLAWRCILWFGVGVSEAYVYNAFDTRFDSLSAGCLLAITLTSPRGRERAAFLARHDWLPLITMIAIWVSRTRLGSGWHYGPGFTVEAALLAVLIVQWIQLAESSCWSWLERPAVRYLGRISYPMYLWHGWGLTASRGLTGFGGTADVLLGLVITTGVASGSYYLLERPFLRLKHRFDPPRIPVGSAPSLTRQDYCDRR
jgi:peptidoglycan/LPS O-acetylase OafA/YrhL